MIGFFGFAAVYVRLEKTRAVILFGVIEIIAGFMSNYEQLSGSRLGTEPIQLRTRIAIIVGGILLMSHGIKQVMDKEGTDKSNIP